MAKWDTTDQNMRVHGPAPEHKPTVEEIILQLEAGQWIFINTDRYEGHGQYAQVVEVDNTDEAYCFRYMPVDAVVDARPQTVTELKWYADANDTFSDYILEIVSHDVVKEYAERIMRRVMGEV